VSISCNRDEKDERSLLIRRQQRHRQIDQRESDRPGVTVRALAICFAEAEGTPVGTGIITPRRGDVERRLLLPIDHLLSCSTASLPAPQYMNHPTVLSGAASTFGAPRALSKTSATAESASFDNPKSSTLTKPSEVTLMLVGFSPGG
jgi:hypothetical protein